MFLALLLHVLFTGDVVEHHATIALSLGEKRFVLRYPGEPERWNGRLLVAAHGGRGGERYSRDGKVLGTDETALDDVIGDYAVAQGFAYASVDRDGIGGTREGLRLMEEFTDLMGERVSEELGRAVEKTYLAGLSMGGGIARFAAEESPPRYDGILIIVGAGGDAAHRAARIKKMKELWPRAEEDGAAYAEAVGTPVEARRFWPFMARSVTGDRSRPPAPGDTTSGAVTVPTIEVAGTYDDVVYPEILVYQGKVRSRGAAERHRLYRVEGAWHISPEDDALFSFQFMGDRMALSDSAIEAMGTGASYLPAVRDALRLLDRWVSDGVAPPPDRTLTESESLLP